MNNNAQWFKKPIWIIVLLVLFFPVGLLLMWLYSTWDKKVKLGITGLFTIFLLLSSSSNHNKNKNDTTVNRLVTTIITTPTAEPTKEPSTPSPKPSITKSAIGVTITVKRVIDGDTIELEDGQKVRYIGIDTPESVDPREPVQCFAQEASSKNKELVEGKIVRLEKDISETDKYGRLLRYVWVGDVFVNDLLVRQGYANASSYPPDVRYQNQFREAEQEARGNNQGLWAKCNTSASPNNSNTATTQQTQASQSSGNCDIKGNISSTGEKIYHLPGCASYTKTVIDTSAGEKWFCTEQEAQQAGWRKAKNCP